MLLAENGARIESLETIGISKDAKFCISYFCRLILLILLSFSNSRDFCFKRSAFNFATCTDISC